MKNITLIIILFFLPFVSIAQKKKEAPKKTKKGAFIKPIINVGASYFEQEMASHYSDAGYNIGFGVEAGYMFGNRIGIYSGIRFNAYSFVDMTYIEDGYKSFWFQSYSEIPLGFRFVTSQKNKFGFLIQAGGILSVLETAQVTLYDTWEDKQLTENSEKLYNKTFASVFIQPGMYIPMGRRVSMDISARGTVSATEVFKSPNYGDMFSLSLNMGLCIRFSK